MTTASHYSLVQGPKLSYYFDSVEFGLYARPEMCDMPRGGILAENMGLGKTLICLGLICLSKHELSVIPSIPDIQKPAFHHKSLVNLCIDTIGRESLPWRMYQNDIPASIARKLDDLPGHFTIDKVDHKTRSLRSGPSRVHRTYYLCSTTLLIVPQNLLHQWSNEVRKHVDSSFLNVLYLSERFNKQFQSHLATYRSTFPGLKEILTYDLVVISSSLFAKLSDDSSVFIIYWKRLIIDEGHSMGSKGSQLSTLCGKLMTERRWVVSGTPTLGLTNLYMNEELDHRATEYVIKSLFNPRDELAKLGTLVGNYFQLEPFRSNPKLWTKIIASELTIGKQRLQLILNSLMVRHGSVDVEKDLELPRLHHKAVFIEPSFHNRMALNLFTSVLAVNAVSSEREGLDYMFDKANRASFRKLINNLRFATFYWTGFKPSEIETLLSIAVKCLEKVEVDNPAMLLDRCLLLDSIRSAKEALGNNTWCVAAQNHEMQYSVSGLMPEFDLLAAGSSLDGQIFGAPQLSVIQEFYYKHRFTKDARVYFDDLWAAIRKFKKSHHKHGDKGKSRKRVKLSTEEVAQPSPFQNSELKDIRESQLRGTASAKLSYLGARLVEHQRQDIKSVVFFEQEDSAYYLIELLDLLGVDYILYATFVGAAQRSNNLSEFARRSGGVALVMDLKLASHGLTIISATRVYFISPVWHASIEAQAIKRAHRIGQTKEVYVETLVLKGTLEEEIFKRRTIPKLLTKHVTDDESIRDYLSQHHFLPLGKDLSSPITAPLTGNVSNDNLGEYLPWHTYSNGWTMYLFTQDNLARLSSAKRQKPDREQLNKELVETPEPRPMPKRQKKSVRF